MKIPKVLAGLLASFLSVSNAYSKVIHEGNCDYLVKDGKVIGSLCTQAPAPSIPKINQRINSLLDLDEIVREHQLRSNYNGFRTSTLIKAMISVENPPVEPWAISPAGAVGLMQILPSTAEMSEDSLKHPETNILLGIKHLDSLYKKHLPKHGKEALNFSLAEYLVGEGNLNGAMVHYNISNWNDMEGVIRDGQNSLRAHKMKLMDSNSTDVSDYVDRIINNYFKFRSLEKTSK